MWESGVFNTLDIPSEEYGICQIYSGVLQLTLNLQICINDLFFQCPIFMQRNHQCVLHIVLGPGPLL